jgi:hypothetical protein
MTVVPVSLPKQAILPEANVRWNKLHLARIQRRHAFMRDEGARYDAAAARMVYAMAMDLFQRKLSEGDLTQIRGSAETSH